MHRRPVRSAAARANPRLWEPRAAGGHLDRTEQVRQEGRGIGLMNKLRAYQLQDAGADTVEANEQLGFRADHREYQLPGSILKYFDVHKVRLLSNNPDKISALERAGIEVVERVPCQVEPIATTEDYLRTKKEKLGHLL